jgi:hypothetical protein
MRNVNRREKLKGGVQEETDSEKENKLKRREDRKTYWM